MAPPNSRSSSPNQSLYSGYDDGDLSLEDRPIGGRATYAQRFVPPSLLNASRRFPFPTQLLSSKPFIYSSIGLTVLALLFLIFPSSSSHSAVYPPQTDWSEAHKLLYNPSFSPSSPADVCAFLDPTRGFSTAELKIIDRLKLAGLGAEDGQSRWVGGRKMDLPNAAQPDYPLGSPEPYGLTNAVEGGQHPLFGLIVRGEQKFRGMVGRRSTSLKDAVKEYRRRYGRPPPKGFDKWWKYVRFLLL